MALASSILERLRAEIEEHAFPHVDRTVTASIGVAQYAAGETINSLIHRADQALYCAKEHGRNCVKQAPATIAPSAAVTAIATSL